MWERWGKLLTRHEGKVSPLFLQLVVAKKNYFRTQFDWHKNNLKTTWKLIGVLVNKKSNSQVTIKKLICDNKCYTDKVSIARKLNNYYINVGRNLADTIPRNDTDPTPNALCFGVFVLRRFTMPL